MNISSISNARFLDEAAESLRNHDNVAQTMAMIVAELHRERSACSMEDWKQFATVTCRQHPLLELLHQDPFTYRAFSKPRGYAGDAEMLDFIYASEDGLIPPVLERTSELGMQICHYTSNGDAPQAVRARRRIIIEKVNEVAASTSKPHVLSLACGHLSEARHCSAFLEGRLGRYVAIDQDTESLMVVQQQVGALGVETVHASVRDVLKGQIALGNFDLIYVSGLHDYLSMRVAQRLSEILFGMLNPGGRLLINNYVPNIINAGYMEVYMDWWLIYRTEAELRQLADTLPSEQVARLHYFTEEQNVIAFLEVERKA